MTKQNAIANIITVLALMLGSACVTDAQSWRVSSMSSSVDMSTNLYADDKNVPNGGPSISIDQGTTFTRDLSSPFGPVDLGANLNKSSVDGAVTSTSSNYVLISGLGTELLTIRWKASFDLRSTNLAIYDARATASTVATVNASFELPEGGQYLLVVNNTRDDLADSLHEGTMFEDPVIANDRLVFTFNFPPGNRISSTHDESNTGADADPRLQEPYYSPHHLSFGGMGTTVVCAGGGQPLLLSVTIDERVSGGLKPPSDAVSVVDIASGVITGEFTVQMTPVPEPAAITLVAATLATVLSCRRKSRSPT